MKSIRECLSKLTYDDLYELGFKLLVDPPKGATKAVWAEMLERELRTIDPDRLRMQFTLNELTALRALAEPLAEDPSVFHVKRWVANRYFTLEQACDTLKYMGLAQSTRDGWLIRREGMDLTDLSKKQEALLTRRDKLIVRLEKPLALSGAMPMDEAFKAAGIRRDDEALVDELMETWSARYGFAGVHIVNKEATWLSYFWCDDPQKIIVAQLSK